MITSEALLIQTVRNEKGAYRVRIKNGEVEYLVAIGTEKIPSDLDVWQLWGFAEYVNGEFNGAWRVGERKVV